jgi:serine/threonine protein kinase/Tol biopolymer transport system component
MGEVYRVLDTNLKRHVAVKVLPESLAGDAARMARLIREAEVLAQLSHPNIAAIYGLERSGGHTAIVMELIEGPTLADRIAQGTIGVEEALLIAKQIAEALEAAHEQGVVHRDLKPSNVKVRDDGTVKVLDFGLAKLVEAPSGATHVDATRSPTLTVAPMSGIGVILGTAAYMSPEQAAGKPVDKRSDIWSFGIVLWEMLVGKPLFAGETIAHTLADVLRAHIDVAQLPVATPAAVRQLLHRCLARDVKQRLRDIGEARIALEGIKESIDTSDPAKPAWTRRRWLWISAGAVLIAAVATSAYLVGRVSQQEIPLLRLSAPFPERASINPGSLPAVSPNGQHLAYSVVVDGQQGLWLRDLTSARARFVPGTVGALHPFWAPDSRNIGFFADGKLKRVNVDGGPVMTLCDAPSGRGGTWNEGGVILFAPTPSSGLFRVSAGGSAPVAVTTPDRAAAEIGHGFPSFLPDGRHYLYTTRSPEPGKTAVYVGNLDSSLRTRLAGATSNAVYTTLGYVLFVREQTLMAQRFDVNALTTMGDPVSIAQDVDYFPGESEGMFSASSASNGHSVLVYTSGWVEGVARLTWLDRAGTVVGAAGPAGAIIRSPAISPAGDAIAYERFDGQRGVYAVWIHDLNRGTDARFTVNPKNNSYPVWSPDGASLAFASDRDGTPKIFTKSVAGVGEDVSLHDVTLATRPDVWSRDFIIETVIHSDTPFIVDQTNRDIWIVPLKGERKPVPLIQTSFDEHDPRLSPNGRWLAYVSNEAQRDEVFVQTFPTPTKKVQVSNGGGVRPVWGKDGRELFFISPEQILMVATVTESGFGSPQALFKTRNAPFDVAANGRFLLPTPTEQAFAGPMTVVVNWPALLKN